MSKYSDKLRREYDKLVKYMDGLNSTDQLGLNAYEINMNQWWDELSERAKNDEEKKIIDDAKTLIRVTFERQRHGGSDGQ